MSVAISMLLFLEVEAEQNIKSEIVSLTVGD